MPDFLVSCINKPNRISPHEHITHIGNDAAGWRLTRDAAIRRSDAGTDSFYTLDAFNRRVSIGVYRDGHHHPYLRTHADGQWNDNLLALPECSQFCPIVE